MTAQTPGAGALLRLAGPIVAAQLAFIGRHTVDTMMAGRLGVETLAAIGIGSALLTVGGVALIGFCLAIAPGVARRHAAGHEEELRGFAAAGLRASVLAWSSLGVIIWMIPAAALTRLGLEPEASQEAIVYMRAVALGAPGLGLFTGARNQFEGLSHSRPVMYLGLAALTLNAVLDYVLMFGWGPIPALGALGCGLATAAADWMLGLGALAIMRNHRVLSRWSPLGVRGVAREHYRELLRVGLPLAMALFVEHALFVGAALMMVSFGSLAVAAHQIALNFVAIVFMIPLGIGQATSVFVGAAVGRGDGAGLRRSGATGYRSAAVIACLATAVMLLLPEAIIALYTDDQTIAGSAVSLLQVAGVFHLLDAFQVVGAGALRGLGDTRAVMQRTLVAYWAVGLPVSYVMAFKLGGGPAGIWWGLTAGLAVAALLLALRWRSVSVRSTTHVGENT